MTHRAHREVAKMVDQLDMQIRKSHKKQNSIDELMNQLESVSSAKKPKLSVNPGTLKSKDYVYSGGIKINSSPYIVRKKHSEDRDHNSATSCTETTGEQLAYMSLCIHVCMQFSLASHNR